MVTVSTTVNCPIELPDLTISVGSSGQITDVSSTSGSFFFISTGSFPVTNGSPLTATCGAFSGTVTITYSGATPGHKMKILKNGSLYVQQTIGSSSGSINFVGVSWGINDTIEITITT